ncbi:hypothetical protein JYU34_021245 [Plutella xylostella]|uniref:Uncharacterized protein n=1 Tax=Plutella xylostella TaxID=51655 RepID=A0ABQ7PT63_PLUXY|nr:hypothetical protein JYU34_021245 [Plutella xylostella]
MSVTYVCVRLGAGRCAAPPPPPRRRRRRKHVGRVCPLLQVSPSCELVPTDLLPPQIEKKVALLPNLITCSSDCSDELWSRGHHPGRFLPATPQYYDHLQ